MKLKWKKYPAGADVVLLEGALRPMVVRGGSGWEVGFPYQAEMGGGWMFPVQGAESADEACERFEAWLANRINIEGLAKLLETERISCCRDPQVRGGKCINCETWIEDRVNLHQGDNEG